MRLESFDFFEVFSRVDGNAGNIRAGALAHVLQYSFRSQFDKLFDAVLYHVFNTALPQHTAGDLLQQRIANAFSIWVGCALA